MTSKKPAGAKASARNLQRFETVYYPMAKQGEFENLRQLSEVTGLSQTELEEYVVNAEIEGSVLIMCDRVALGDPANEVYAVLRKLDGGRCSLWAAFIAEASTDRKEVEQFICEFRLTINRDMAVGEFRQRIQGNA